MAAAWREWGAECELTPLARGRAACSRPLPSGRKITIANTILKQLSLDKIGCSFTIPASKKIVFRLSLTVERYDENGSAELEPKHGIGWWHPPASCHAISHIQSIGYPINMIHQIASNSFFWLVTQKTELSRTFHRLTWMLIALQWAEIIHKQLVISNKRARSSCQAKPIFFSGNSLY